MGERDAITGIESEIRRGIGLAKCLKCGCMKDALEDLRSAFSSLQVEGSLLRNTESWLEQMQPVKYACLGCEHCFPAEAMNAFHLAFPNATGASSPSCVFEIREQAWPAVAGEYFALCEGEGCPVAVSTLGSADLAEKLARERPKELCIVGKTETENIGIDKVIKNVITNPTIRFLLLAGQDPKGHRSGKTLLAVSESGVDERMRVIGSPGRRPVLRNVSREEVEAFRKQVQVVDLIGCEDVQTIVAKLEELGGMLGKACACGEPAQEKPVIAVSTVPIIEAGEPAKVEMDKAGYFVIIPQPEKMVITLEHYSYANLLLRVIEGKDARSIYWTVTQNGWVSQLSHAAYLGKELARAELSIKLGFKYVQDGA